MALDGGLLGQLLFFFIQLSILLTI